MSLSESSVRRLVVEASREFDVPEPSVVFRVRDEVWGEPPDDGGYYVYEEGRFFPPGDSDTGSFRVGNPTIGPFSSPTIVIYTPQGLSSRTVLHEFAHYLEWLDNRGNYGSLLESDVREYEQMVFDRLL